MKSAHERASNRVPRTQKQTLELDSRSVPGRSFVAAKKVILPTRSREHFHTRTAFAESFFFTRRVSRCDLSHVTRRRPAHRSVSRHRSFVVHRVRLHAAPKLQDRALTDWTNTRGRTLPETS